VRILLLAQFFPPDVGGEEFHVLNLANALALRGHEVAVATQRMSGVPDEVVLPTGVRIHRLSTAAMRLPGVYATYRKHHPPVPDPLGVRELRRIVDEERPEIVHAHNWIVNSALALRHRSNGGANKFGLVLTLHDYSHVCGTKRFIYDGAQCAGPRPGKCLGCSASHYGPIVGPLTAIANFAMRPWKNAGIDHIVSVSNAVARANGIAASPSASVIPNFIPDSLLTSEAVVPPSDRRGVASRTTPDEPFLLFVGELSREKGVETLLHAYNALGEDRPPLLVVGRRTADTPAHVPLGASLCFEWPHEDVMVAFRRCSAAILPSIVPDACPTTVLEAMANGCAIVSTSTGGIVDMIVAEESGLLVAPGDSDALAAALRRVLASEELRSRLGAGARDRVHGFTASAVVERLESVYTRVAMARSRGSESAWGLKRVKSR
jgi:glycosyltransferase involved in cell wall biosynthesis